MPTFLGGRIAEITYKAALQQRLARRAESIRRVRIVAPNEASTPVDVM